MVKGSKEQYLFVLVTYKLLLCEVIFLYHPYYTLYIFTPWVAHYSYRRPM